MSREDNELHHTTKSWPGGPFGGSRRGHSIPVRFLGEEHMEQMDMIPLAMEAFDANFASLHLTLHLAFRQALIAMQSAWGGVSDAMAWMSSAARTGRGKPASGREGKPDPSKENRHNPRQTWEYLSRIAYFPGAMAPHNTWHVIGQATANFPD